MLFVGPAPKAFGAATGTPAVAAKAAILLRRERSGVTAYWALMQRLHVLRLPLEGLRQFWPRVLIEQALHDEGVVGR